MSRGWFSVFTGLAIGFVLLAAPLRGQFAYVANFESNNVSAYSIDGSNGTLTPIPGSPFAAGSNPISVAVAPTGQFVIRRIIGWASIAARLFARMSISTPTTSAFGGPPDAAFSSSSDAQRISEPPWAMPVSTIRSGFRTQTSSCIAISPPVV